MTTVKYITVEDVALYNGISPRAVHFRLKRGNKPHRVEGTKLKGVKDYRKLSAAKTSAYIITPDEQYLKDDKHRTFRKA